MSPACGRIATKDVRDVAGLLTVPHPVTLFCFVFIVITKPGEAWSMSLLLLLTHIIGEWVTPYSLESGEGHRLGFRNNYVTLHFQICLQVTCLILILLLQIGHQQILL